MEILLVAVVALLVIAAVHQVAPRVGLASPLVLLGLGIAVGFLPMVAAVEVDPEIVLQVVLPPLLFGAAVSMPVMDVRRELLAVSGLAVGLVVGSAVVLGATIHAVVPEVSLPWAIALGAVLSPTDAVAVTIAKRLGVSQRIITILEGEGLFNDATALVLLSSATSAALLTDTHALEPGNLALGFVTALVVAVLVGLVVGELSTRVCARMSDPTANTVVSFTIPFLASVPAEHLGGSGLVAAVVAGLVGSLRAPLLVPPANRRVAQQNWATLVLVLEGGVFLVMGLQAYGIVHEVESTGGLVRAVLVAALAGGLTVVLRAAFVVPLLAWLRVRARRSQRRHERHEERMRSFEQRLRQASDLDEAALAACDVSPADWQRTLLRWTSVLERKQRRHRRRGYDLAYLADEPLGPREASVIVWAGMRGAVTLAAAQTLPLEAPMRPFLLLVALLVAAGSLIIQGLTLPALVAVVRPQLASDRQDADERGRLVALLGGAVKDTALAQALATGAAPTGPGVVVGMGRLSLGAMSQELVPASDDAPPHVSGDAPDAARPPAHKAARVGDPAGDDPADPVAAGVAEPGGAARSLTRAQVRELAIDAIREQRRALLEARDEGLFSSAALGYALERLDAEEILLSSRH